MNHFGTKQKLIATGVMATFHCPDGARPLYLEKHNGDERDKQATFDAKQFGIEKCAQERGLHGEPENDEELAMRIWEDIYGTRPENWGMKWKEGAKGMSDAIHLLVLAIENLEFCKILEVDDMRESGEETFLHIA